MAVEKVGIYRKWLGPVPQDSHGLPLPRSVWPRKRRYRWVVRWYGTTGRRYGKVFAAKHEAERFAAELHLRVTSGRADRPRPITLAQFRREHAVVMRGQVAPTTLTSQLRALRFFEKFMGGSFAVSKLKPWHAEAFVAERLSTVPSVATVNKDIRTLRGIFNRAIEPRHYLNEGGNPFAKIKERQTTANEIRYVRAAEYKALLAEARTDWWRAFLTLAYGSGLRRNEILHLTWADVDFALQRVRVCAKKGTGRTLAWEPKNHRSRVVPMASSSCQCLANLQAEAGKTHPYVFIRPQRLSRIQGRIAAGQWRDGAEVINNLSRDFELICHRANVADCTPHDLRRSAITNWARRLPIQVVQTLAGHASITTTRRYYLAVRPEDLRVAGDLVDELTASGDGQTDTILTPRVFFYPKTDPRS